METQKPVKEHVVDREIQEKFEGRDVKMEVENEDLGKKGSKEPDKTTPSSTNPPSPATQPTPHKPRPKHSSAPTLFSTLMANALSFTPGNNHRHLRITLTPAKFEEESYELYRKYQIAVHHDAEEDVTKSGFKRFLVESPLIVSFL